ncbi:MAG: MarR family transcriptional regulator [Bacteroidetes bacterium]|nr:MarR family transcriptional regulator [Bacteroidota bacterium]
MNNDFLKELGYLGLIARFKRLSDSMLYSIRDLYKLEDIDIEPNWHLVFLILKKYKTRTITEIAKSFHISQPAIVKIINKMEKKGYIDIIKDTHDNRKRQLQLSQKAISQLPKFEKIWQAGRQSIKEMLEGNQTFLDLLENFEQQIEDKSFKERVSDHL